MSSAANPETTAATSADPRTYVVVARRYRPQTFEELIGQEHVAQALRNAITTNRVGHAYLFTGRGAWARRPPRGSSPRR